MVAPRHTSEVRVRPEYESDPIQSGFNDIFTIALVFVEEGEMNWKKRERENYVLCIQGRVHGL